MSKRVAFGKPPGPYPSPVLGHSEPELELEHRVAELESELRQTRRDAKRELLDSRAETIALLVLGFGVGMYLLLRDERLGALTSEPVTSSEWWGAALTVVGAVLGLVFVGAIAGAAVVVPIRWLLKERDEAKQRRAWREDGP